MSKPKDDARNSGEMRCSSPASETPIELQRFGPPKVVEELTGITNERVERCLPFRAIAEFVYNLRHWCFGNPLFSMGVLMLNELEIDLIKQERDICKAALKACRAECQKRGITSAEFAKMCGISRVQLTVYTGATPTTEPDFVESVEHRQARLKSWDDQRDAIANEYNAKRKAQS